MTIKKSLNNNQKGFVSIIVTMIMLIVLTLIVLGFAQRARREQRSALDRQLSTQAFYAAESGINDFMNAINNGIIDTKTNPTRTNCTDPLPAGITTNVVDSTTNVEFTCVLYNTSPPTLEFGQGKITTNHVTVVPINNTDLTKMSFSWDHSPSDTTFAASPTGVYFKTFTGWTSNVGVLRVQLIPRDIIGRLSYISNSYTGFLYPFGTATGTGTGTYAAGSDGFNSSGDIVTAWCNTANTPHKCNAEITGLQYNTKGYYLVLRSIYKDSEVSVTCYNGVGASTPCEGAQVQIDATGKANGVLRRIEKRVPVTAGDSDFLPIGFESVDNICKQIVITPPSTVKDAQTPLCTSF